MSQGQLSAFVRACMGERERVCVCVCVCDAQIRHDQTVTWLAFWKDTVSQKDYKYVFLGATSSWKGESDQVKYEKVSVCGCGCPTETGHTNIADLKMGCE